MITLSLLVGFLRRLSSPDEESVGVSPAPSASKALFLALSLRTGPSSMSGFLSSEDSSLGCFAVRSLAKMPNKRREITAATTVKPITSVS